MIKRLLAVSAIMIAGLIVFLHAANSTYAANNSSVGFYANVSSNTTLAVEIDSTADENVIINLTPNPGTTAFQDSDDVNVTVASNNCTGYYLLMSTTSENLINTADDTLYIPSLDPSNTTGYTSATFPANTWGYSLKTGNDYSNFFGIGTSVTLQDSGTSAQNTSTIKFGTKVDSTLPSGVYTTSIVFTTIAKPSLFMQDVTQWKDTVAIGESIQAIDGRDMKTYWVTRMETDPAIPDDRADCTGTGANRVCSQLWMTQNLDLRLSANTTTFTHRDTDLGWTDGDVDTVWTPRNATTGSAVTFSNLADNTERSFAYNETDSQYIYTSSTVSNDIPYMDLEACIEAGHTEDDCRHYHRGTLYSFYTAAALGATSSGTAVAVSGEKYSVMPNSVCPAGWRLPTGLTSAGDHTDFDYLLYQNDITAAHGGEDSITGQSIDPGYATDGFIKLRTQPIWFVRTGCVGASTTINNASNARYWANSVNNGIHNGYYIDVFSNRVDPADSTFTGYGFSVRCIAR